MSSAVMHYTMTVGTDDPQTLSADTDDMAIREAVGYLRQHHADDLRSLPDKVVTLMSPAGLVTRPSERLDEFVERVTGSNPATEADTLQPGDSNAPDCNGD